MTYKEWMSATCSKFNLSSDDIDLILTNQSKLITDSSATVDVTVAKTALCKEFATLIPLANVSEGGYSISWNIEAIKLWYQQVSNELGMTSASAPRVRNASWRW